MVLMNMSLASKQDHAPASGEGPGSASHSTDCDIPGLPLNGVMAQERLICSIQGQHVVPTAHQEDLSSDIEDML